MQDLYHQQYPYEGPQGELSEDRIQAERFDFRVAGFRVQGSGSKA